MSRLTWDPIGQRTYETGVDRGVLFPIAADGTYENGVAWDGLTGVTSSPSGAEPTPFYANNKKYLNIYSTEEYGCTISAYQSPEEFDECDGTVSPVAGVKLGQQKRKGFGFAYRSLIGNDTEGTKHGYTIHLVYGCMASPSERSYATVNDSPEAVELSWEVSTTPVEIDGFEPICTIDIVSTSLDATKLAALEAKLYGDDSAEATLPSPAEVLTLCGYTAA